MGREVLGAKRSNTFVVFRIGMKGENVVVHLLLGGVWGVVGSTRILFCGEGARRRTLGFTSWSHRSCCVAYKSLAQSCSTEDRTH